MRLRIDLAYDGTGFHGWAAQPGLRTVQGELEAALATVLRVAEAPTVCAGRTDAGVHARGQVVQVDLDTGPDSGPDSGPDTRLDTEADLAALTRRLNGVLADDLRVGRVAVAAPGFDARFSPLWRRYAYRLCDGVPDPLTRGHVLTWPRRLDVEAMGEASRPLLGLHDFAAFCRRREGSTTVRTLQELVWLREGDLVTGTVRADAFCHHMVRSLVGCLVAVGEGRRPVGWPGEVLAAAERDPAVVVVPPHGLTLEEVGYPDDAGLAARAHEARARRDEPVNDASR